MRRYWIWATLILALALVVGCRPIAAGEEPAATEDVDLGVCKPGEETGDCDDDTSDEEPTAEPAPEPTEQPAEPVGQDPTTETLEDLLALRDTDWVLGADEPVITLIEYGDYL